MDLTTLFAAVVRANAKIHILKQFTTVGNEVYTNK